MRGGLFDQGTCFKELRLTPLHTPTYETAVTCNQESGLHVRTAQ
jgi:hypothetical protein